MNKNKTGLRSYRMKLTYEDLPQSVKKYFPPNVNIPRAKKDYLDYLKNPLPDSLRLFPGTAVTTVTTSQRQKEQNSLKPPPSDNPQ